MQTNFRAYKQSLLEPKTFHIYTLHDYREKKARGVTTKVRKELGWHFCVDRRKKVREKERVCVRGR